MFWAYQYGIFELDYTRTKYRTPSGKGAFMEKIEISPLADRNEQLGEIYDYLDQLKEALSDIVYDMDAEDEAEAETVDTLTDALEQIDDALDAIADVIE